MMRYLPLGQTGLSVSHLCLGTMTFGDQTPPDDAFRQMDMAVEAGINLFDTAELYAIPPRPETQGRSEEIIGDWLAARGQRDKVMIATKIVGPGPMTWIRNGETRLDATHVRAAVESSLKRLKTDYIDLYQIHWPQRPANIFGKLGYDMAQVTGREGEQIAETLAALDDEVKAGRIRAIGLSNETPYGVMTWLKHHAAGRGPRVASIQNPYSLLNRTFDIGLAEIAMQEKVGLLAYAPLAAGTLTGKYLDGAKPQGSRRAHDSRPSRYERPRADEAVREYMAVAQKHGIDIVHFSLAFVNSRPFLASNIIGATTAGQLAHILKAPDLRLPAEALADIEAVHMRTPNPCP